MGTVFSIDVRTPETDPQVLADVVALLHEIDDRYSTYRSDSPISRLARGDMTLADVADRDVAAEIGQVLAGCNAWTERSDGWFSAYATGTLDPSGYVKGWAIQRASDLLTAAGSTSHMINGGGDILCVGDAGGRDWNLAVTDPFDACSTIATITGRDLALATSGTAQRCGHIADPHTGSPAGDDLISLTVAGRSIIACDVLATAGIAMGQGAEDFFRKREDVHAFAVLNDGTRWSTLATSPAPVG